MKRILLALLAAHCLPVLAAEPRDPAVPGRTIALLVVYMLNGELTVKTYQVPTMQQCIWSLPAVAKIAPDTASLSCVSLLNEDNV